MSLIEITEVRKAFGDNEVLKGINLDVAPGEVIAIIGKSGSGKSTLGRALLKLLQADGAFRFGTNDITSLDRAGMRPFRKQMQLVFQDPYGSLSPRQTVGEIITEGLYVHEPQLSRAERDQRAIAALKEVGLDPAARNRYPHEFSGGQRQRIAIARSIILKPKVVILDEPTSGVSSHEKFQVMDTLTRALDARATTAIFVEHDMDVVARYASRVAVWSGGRIALEGTPDEILNHPEVRETVIGVGV